MRWPEWLGVGERRWKRPPDEEVQPPKTLWDFLQLLIVPAILVVIALAFNASQASRERKREDRRMAADRAAAEQVREDATLNDYFKQMSDLMLHERLLSSKPGDPVRSVGQTVTLTTLRRLDKTRRDEVVNFLEEAGLITGRGHGPRISLSGVDLAGANLAGANLAGARLSGVNLSGADLTGVNLSGADLKDADLKDADLKDSNLVNAILVDADLKGADLSGVDLKGADLLVADLRGADLNGARLMGARLVGAKGVHTGSR